MATFSDPNEKAPVPPQEPSPPATKSLEQMPKEGITAGDLAMQQAPDPNKDPYGYMLFVMENGFSSVHQRLDQQGRLVADMAEKVYGPQKEEKTASAAQDGLGGIINTDTIGRFIDLAKSQMTQSDPMKEYFASLGKTMFEGTLNTTMKSVQRSLGHESAGNIIHVG